MPIIHISSHICSLLGFWLFCLWYCNLILQCISWISWYFILWLWSVLPTFDMFLKSWLKNENSFDDIHIEYQILSNILYIRVFNIFILFLQDNRRAAHFNIPDSLNIAILEYHSMLPMKEKKDKINQFITLKLLIYV